jgi:hypothetical protein
MLFFDSSEKLNLISEFLTDTFGFFFKYYKQNFEGKQFFSFFVIILFIKRPNKPQEEIDDIIF